MEICVNDVVKVVNGGARYTSYDGYFTHYGIDEYLTRYTGSGRVSQKEGIVLFKGLHATFHDPMLYVIRLFDSDNIVLMGERGIELVSKSTAPELQTEVSSVPISDLLGI